MSATMMSPGILRRADSTKKELNVTFEDSVPLDLEAILMEADRGSTDKYDELCTEISKGMITRAALSELLQQMGGCVGQLAGERHQALVRGVLACSWHELPPEDQRRYFSLTELLVAARPASTADAVRVLVHSLQFVSELDPLADEPLPGEFTEAEQLVHKLAVDSLFAILRVVPIAMDLLLQTLAQRQPYLKRPARLQAAYYNSVLKLAWLLPQIRPKLLRVVYQRLLALDLLCPREELTAGKDAVPEAAALDALMLVTLRQTELRCYPAGDRQLHWTNTKHMYAELVKIFSELALSAPSTSHAQFWLLWMAARRRPLAEHLLDWLWRRVQDVLSPAVLRQAAALYIGSFLARAQIVDVELLRTTLEVMCGWVHRYLNQQDSVARERPDYSVHRPFYAVCQTLFYVFAFRHSELPPTEENLPFLRSLNYERLVTSQLNPLRFCPPAVVQNFASVARHYQLAYCYTVIERNNRIRIPVVVSSGFGIKKLEADQLYCSFFPFDPYLLKHSAVYFRECYREYAGGTGAESDSESDSDSDDEMEADAAFTPSSPLAEFNYGVSPGFKH